MEEGDQSPIRDDDKTEILSETLANMRETVHNMKLNDAIHRQNARKMERENRKLEDESSKQQKHLTELERQKAIDEQYLIKQNELIYKLQTATQLGERANESDNLKDEIREQRESNRENLEFVQQLEEKVDEIETYFAKMKELDELTDLIPDA